MKAHTLFLYFVAVTFTSFIPSMVLAQDEKMTVQNVNTFSVFSLYYQMFDEPLPVADVMKRMDPSVRNFSNEFEKRRIYNERLPEFEKFIRKIEQGKTFQKKFTVSLGDYDFNKQIFPVEKMYDNLYFRFGSGSVGIDKPDFSASVINSDEFQTIKMPPERAENLAVSIGKNNREFFAVFKLEPIDAGMKLIKKQYGSTLYRNVDFYASEVSFYAEGESTPFYTVKASSARPTVVTERKPIDIKLDLGNPWLASDPYTAVLEKYSYMKAPETLEVIMDYRASRAEACVDEFGYTDCKTLATYRSNFLNACERAKNTNSGCDLLMYIPYTRDELAAATQ